MNAATDACHTTTVPCGFASCEVHYGTREVSMTDTTTPAELQIPQAAVDEWFVCGCSETSCVRAGYQADALPIIVAAELRRVADEAGDRDRANGAVRYTDGYFDGASMVRDLLTDRADELDSQP